jgi:carbamate kinase
MYLVVIYNHYLHSPSAVVGPFNSKQEATAWMNEKDCKLSSDESMAVHSVTPSHLVLQ